MNLPVVGDTIAAVATPPGRGGVAIVRVSGPQVVAIAEGIIGRRPSPRLATRARFLDREGGEIDNGLALFFPAPASFTGEDVLELQGHGGPVVSRMVIDRVCDLGARPARAGEFTLRAFLNDRIDLAQAEAVADLIDSASESAARSAIRSLGGEFSRTVGEHRDALVALRVFIEAAIDFPEEELDLLADPEIIRRLDALRQALATTLAESGKGAMLREGVRLVIAGAPNVGKSSLLNRLARSEAAIVTDIPGTTRDPVRERLVIAGIPFEVRDTAGLRRTRDPVERIGVERAQAALEDADLALLVFDDTSDITDDIKSDPGKIGLGVDIFPQGSFALPERLFRKGAGILVRNKIDLSGSKPGLVEDRFSNSSSNSSLTSAKDGNPAARDPASGAPPLPVVRVSALTGAGIADLEEAIVKKVTDDSAGFEHAFMARRRHVSALEKALAALDRARSRLVEDKAGEICAEELRSAQNALAEITGAFATEDLLAEIFSGFCIGK
ncbi:tRNA uridine-5-carboxymethylaminomethyl(34) synthesis GTPase MnmE [Thioalkalivibrio sp. HK1]|uniref:tRNA uridine-5-carboxymethylaminomethyl(34) synthesis GTPase MnmE n=1 Tax=Thioalkalivibrio sp. HK1 TaxID=1469245 RepID=UPI00047043AC|nr:tRNA uridine-5-carboxymethylaminomethyl(34) synthesis GTPase MnmE [Thioalkalivibrio sp. HK1]